jgi:hypothetical protein
LVFSGFFYQYWCFKASFLPLLGFLASFRLMLVFSFDQ